MRKQFLTSAAVLALSAGAAFAADLPTHKAPPPPAVPAPFSWTGFYVGVQAGYGWGQESDNLRFPTAAPIVDDHFNLDGAFGGARVGYDQQFNTFVLGVVADVDATDISGKKTASTPAGPGTLVGTLSQNNTWQSSLRLRAGVAFDRLLIYATGGVAFADDQEKNSLSWNSTSGSFHKLLSSGSQTDTLYGWTVGGGAEYAMTDHWIASAELRYADFDNGNYWTTGTNHHHDITIFHAGFDETLAQLGLSYKF
jgi:outer membrane immunogenic protein